MDKRTANLFKKLRNLFDFYNKNPEKIQANPFTYKMFGTVLGIYSDVTDMLTAADQSVAEAWQVKDEDMELMVELADVCFRILRSFGRYENFQPFMNLTGCSRYELQRGKEENAFIHVKKLIEVAVANSEQATEAGLTAASIPDLTAAMIAAEASTGKALKLRSMRRKANEKVDELINQFSHLLHGSLIDHMSAIYKGTDPQFYSEFDSAIDISSTSVGKVQLRGRFTNEEGEIVRRVSVSIDGDDETLHGGDRGGYQFRNLDYGVRVVTFSCPAYHTQMHTVVIRPDSLVELDIQFVAVSEAHPNEDVELEAAATEDV